MGASSGGPTRVERLQLGHEPRRDVPSAGLAERLVQVLRGSRRARRASGRGATGRREGKDVVELSRDPEATSLLEPEDGIALRGAYPDLDHGLRRATVRHDRVERRAPDRSPEEGLKCTLDDMTIHLPKGTHKPL